MPMWGWIETLCLSFLICKTEMIALKVMGRNKRDISTKCLKQREFSARPPQPPLLLWGPWRAGTRDRRCSQSLRHTQVGHRYPQSPHGIQIPDQHPPETGSLKLKGGLPRRTWGHVPAPTSSVATSVLLSESAVSSF